MSEYLSKKAVLEWLDQRASNLHWGARQADHHEIIDKSQSGAFDADDSEIQRLRAALEEVRECLDDFWDRDTPRRLYKEVRRFAGQIHVMEKVINQALSTTSEPTVAERVREEIRGLLQQWDFRGIAEQLDSGYEKSVVIELVELCEKLTGAKSPRINAPEGDGNDA